MMMTWEQSLSIFVLAFSGVSLCFLIYTTFQGWRAHRRVQRAERDYREALEKATAHLKANPQGWLDAMAMMDDKRRMH